MVTNNNVAYVEAVQTAHISPGALSLDDLFQTLAEGDPDFHEGLRLERANLASSLYGEEVSLKTLRLKKGLSQAELAEAIGQKQPNIYRYESGRTDPTLSVVAKLAAALDIPLGKLAEAMHGQHHD